MGNVTMSYLKSNANSVRRYLPDVKSPPPQHGVMEG